MNNEIKTSIIVPVYNVEKYLPRCLDSILRQTLKSIELICINDGSTDSSLSILQEYKKRDNRIKIIDQNNKMLGAARNAGLNVACGEYIGFIDSDDYVSDNYFESLYYNAKKYDADVACTNIIRKRTYNEKYRLLYRENNIYNTTSEKLKVITTKKDYCLNVGGKIFKRNFLDKNSLKFEEGVFFEDINFMTPALYLSNKIVTVPNASYYYCVRSDSIVKGKSSKKKRDDLLNAFARFYAYCRKNNIEISTKNISCREVYLRFLNHVVILSSKTEFAGDLMISKLKLFNLITVHESKRENPFMGS